MFVHKAPATGSPATHLQDYEDTVTSGPVEIVLTTIDGKPRTALLLNHELLSGIQETAAMIEEYDTWRNRRKKEEIQIIRELEAASEHFHRVDYSFGLAKIRAQKRGYQHPPWERQELLRLHRVWVGATDRKKSAHERKMDFVQHMRDTEMDFYEKFKKVHGIFWQSFQESKVMENYKRLYPRTGYNASKPKSNTLVQILPQDAGTDSDVSPLPPLSYPLPAEMVNQNSELGAPYRPRTFEPIPFKEGGAISVMVDANHKLKTTQHDLYYAYVDADEQRASYRKDLHVFASKKRKHVDEVESEFGPIFCEDFMYACRKVGDAEEAVQAAREDAKAAGVPNTVNQTSNFGSEEDEPIDYEYQAPYIHSTSRKRMRLWLDESIGPDRTGSKSEEPIQLLQSSSPEYVASPASSSEYAISPASSLEYDAPKDEGQSCQEEQSRSDTTLYEQEHRGRLSPRKASPVPQQSSVQKTEKNVTGQEIEEDVTGQETEKNVTGQDTEKDVTGQETEKDVTGQETEKDITGQDTEKDVTAQETEKDITGQDTEMDDVTGQETEKDVTGQETEEEVPNLTFGDRNFDQDEKEFQFSFFGDLASKDNPGCVDSNPRHRARLDKLKKQSKELRKEFEKEGIRAGRDPKSRRQAKKLRRSRSVDVYQAVRKPLDDPRMASYRPAFTSIAPELEIEHNLTEVIVTQADPTQKVDPKEILPGNGRLKRKR